DPRGVGREFEEFDTRAVAEEDADQADGDAEVPEDDRRHERGGRAGRNTAHPGQEPDGETETRRAGPAVNERIDGGGPDATEGEHAEVVRESDEPAEWREGILRMSQRRGVD